MTSKELVGSSVQFVTFVLGMFGGFLKSVAPPDEARSSLPVGAASAIALVAYLFIIALTRRTVVRRATRRWWLAASAAFLVSFVVLLQIYDADRERLTFLWPPQDEQQELYMAGDTLTPDGEQARDQYPNYSSSELVSGFGGMEQRTDVWPDDAIRRAGRRLRREYVALVVCLVISIVTLTEGVLLRGSHHGRSAGRP